jgi:hypothetical protein
MLRDKPRFCDKMQRARLDPTAAVYEEAGCQIGPLRSESD